MKKVPENKKTLGTEGEKIAAEFLKKNNYNILTTNFRYSRLGEIDIIARENNYICFIEVKTRSGVNYGFPIESIDFRKRENIKKLANIFIAKHNFSNENIRFDVVEVYLKKEREVITVENINLVKNAF